MSEEQTQALIEAIALDTLAHIEEALRSGKNWKVVVSGNANRNDFAVRTELSSGSKITVSAE